MADTRSDSPIAQAHIQGKESRGTANFYRSGAGDLSLAITDLWIAPGPEVHLHLSTDEDGNLKAGDAVHIGPAPTDRNYHEQNLTGITHIEAFKTLVVHCKPYDVYFGVGKIERITTD